MERLQDVLAELDDIGAQLGMYSPLHEGRMNAPKKMGELRRFRDRQAVDNTNIVTLAQGPAGLRWIPGPWIPKEVNRHRERSVRQYRYTVLQPSDISRYLERLDELINDRISELGKRRSCLRKWNLRCQSAKFPSGNGLRGTVLLLIHGQWSSGQSVFDQIKSSSTGREFVRNAAENYDYILSFEHETLSSSPISNAADLYIATQNWKGANIDVVSHGRGGLVARMAFELLTTEIEPRKMVFVGSAMDGWGNAYSKGLLDTLSFLINLYVHTAKDPRLIRSGRASLGLMRIFGSIQSRIIDIQQTGIATAMLVSGLSGASANSRDISRLRECATNVDLTKYYSFTSQFSPEANAGLFDWSFAAPQRDYPSDYMTPTFRAQSMGPKAKLPEENRRVLASPTTYFDKYFADEEVFEYLNEVLMDD